MTEKRRSSIPRKNHYVRRICFQVTTAWALSGCQRSKLGVCLHCGAPCARSRCLSVFEALQHRRGLMAVPVRGGARHVVLLLLALLAAFCCVTPALARATATAARCLPQCTAKNVLPAFVTKLRRGTDEDLECHTRMRTRDEALHTLRGTWVIILGNSCAA